MKLSLKRLIVLSFSFGFFLTVSQEAMAMFTLSASPVSGGARSIHFNSARPGTYAKNEEVTISVESTLATQYMIYQEVDQPLTNETGKTIPQGAFIVFSPSSPMGTVKTQLETPVSMGQVNVFTSNGAGDSDSFVLVYNVNIPADQPGGQYRTQIRFMAQPVSGSGQSSVVILDVVLDIRSTAFKITIENSKHSRELDLGHISKDRLIAADVLNIVTEGNTEPYVITQQMTEPLTSQEGQEIDPDYFHLTAAGGDKGDLNARGTAIAVPISVQRLYVSDSGAADGIFLQYTVTPEITQKAGVYRGMLTFKIESNALTAPTEPINLPIKLEVDPIFYLDVDMPEVTRVNFGVYKNAGEKRSKEVTLTAYSNLGQQYQISQIVSNKMMNEKGELLPEENFTYFGASAQTGRLSTLSPLPVKEGETVVFTSDAKGTPEKFVLAYELATPQSPRKGTYDTNIDYSITAL